MKIYQRNNNQKCVQILKTKVESNEDIQTSLLSDLIRDHNLYGCIRLFHYAISDMLDVM